MRWVCFKEISPLRIFTATFGLMLFPHFRQKFHFILPIQRSKVWIQKYLFVFTLDTIFTISWHNSSPSCNTAVCWFVISSLLSGCVTLSLHFVYTAGGGGRQRRVKIGCGYRRRALYGSSSCLRLWNLGGPCKGHSTQRLRSRAVQQLVTILDSKTLWPLAHAKSDSSNCITAGPVWKTDVKSNWSLDENALNIGKMMRERLQNNPPSLQKTLPLLQSVPACMLRCIDLSFGDYFYQIK